MSAEASRGVRRGTPRDRMPGTLYVVSTPIGNLDDITVRALNTLKSVGLVAAEDTRRSSILLRHFGIPTPITSLHEHNEKQKTRHLLQKLLEGTDIALVSDAGTPLVADPGRLLITLAAESGIRVVPIPGASAVVSALAVAGFPADEFVFAGFAPSRSSDRKKWLQQLSREPRTVVFFEAPHRISETLANMGDLLGDRPIIVARELTKAHEQIVRTTANRAAEVSLPQRGEFTIVLGAHSIDLDSPQEVGDKEISAYFYQVTKSAPSRRAALVMTADKFGLSTKDVYTRLERARAAGHLDRFGDDLLP